MNYEPDNSAHGQRSYILVAPATCSYPNVFFSHVFVTCNAVLTEFCVFAAVQIYHSKLHKNEEIEMISDR